MTCILVATDGSEGADRAVDYAAQLAKTENAELLIIHVTGGYGVPDNVFRQFTRAEQTWLREQLESVSNHILNAARARARATGVATIFLESRTGDVAETIIDVAEQKDAANIVVGKRGVGRIAALLLGSVSQKVVSLAHKPVTVVP